MFLEMMEYGTDLICLLLATPLQINTQELLPPDQNTSQFSWKSWNMVWILSASRDCTANQFTEAIIPRSKCQEMFLEIMQYDMDFV